MATPRSPKPVDAYVGSRVKARRTELGMSQEKLGEALGVTFQQVQKYEKGSNRISFSRMHAIAEVLDLPIEHFLKGMPVAPSDELPVSASPHGQMADSMSQTAMENDVLASPEGSRLNRAFVRIRDADVRARLVDLVCAVADAQDAPKR